MLKEGDFIEIEYTARLKDRDIIFDLTDEKLAKEKGIYNPNVKYGPVILCLGQNHILPGLDKNLIGKELGNYVINLLPEDGFGKKDPKLIRILPTSVFRKQKINPMPGLQLNIDGRVGLVRSVTGGRTSIDFNHPMAGKELTYDIKINKVVKESKEKIDALLKILLLLKEPKTKVDKGIGEISLKEKLPEAIEAILKEKIKSLISEIKEVKIIIENK